MALRSPNRSHRHRKFRIGERPHLRWRLDEHGDIKLALEECSGLHRRDVPPIDQDDPAAIEPNEGHLRQGYLGDRPQCGCLRTTLQQVGHGLELW